MAINRPLLILILQQYSDGMNFFQDTKIKK